MNLKTIENILLNNFINHTKQDIADQEIMPCYLFAFQEQVSFISIQIDKFNCNFLFDLVSKLLLGIGFLPELTNCQKFCKCIILGILPCDYFSA